MSLIEYNKSKIAGCKLEIREVLSSLNVSCSLLDEYPTMGECAPLVAPVDPHPHETATTSGSEGTLEPHLHHIVRNTDSSRPFLLQPKYLSLRAFNPTRVRSA